jgi:hypothetical protein
VARWTASAKWAAGPALDGLRDAMLALRLTEGLGSAAFLACIARLYGKLATCCNQLCARRNLETTLLLANKPDNQSKANLAACQQSAKALPDTMGLTWELMQRVWPLAKKRTQSINNGWASESWAGR